jgi:DNA-binding GntR family transcriptional regulator
LDPIPAQSRHHVETVHEILRSAILRGEIPAGRITTQAALSDQLGVGRTPLREALRMLQSEGLVVSERNRQVQIADLSADDAEQLYVMRIALETAAIRITVPTLTSDSFAELEGAMAQMDHYMRVEDQPGMRTPHRLFHRILNEGAGERVSRGIAELFDHAERYRLQCGATAPWEKRRQEHRDFARPFPSEEVRLTSIYSKEDGVVHWQCQIIPDADTIEVTGSHVGLIFNRKVYRAIADALARPELTDDEHR